jgi:hypothetical protein
MSATEQIQKYRARCVPDIARLRMLALDLADKDASTRAPRVAQEIVRATTAILALVRAGCRTCENAAAEDVRDLGVSSLLTTRLNRLEEAAAAAVAAASEGNVNSLRRHLWRFDALTRAMWTVVHSTATGGSRVPRAFHIHRALHPQG